MIPVPLLRPVQDYLHTHRNLYLILSYALANVLPSLASFFLVLIYTAAFTVGDFGRYSISIAMVTLVGVGIELGMPGGLIRDYYDRHRDDRAAEHLASAIHSYRLVSLATVPIGAVIIYLAWPLRSTTAWITIATVIIIALIAYFERLAEMLGSVSRGIDKPTYFVLGRAVSAAITIIAAAVLVGGLHSGVMGALLARLAGTFVTCEVYRNVMARGAKIAGGKFSWVQVKSYLKFGLPLMPNRLAVWAQQNGLKPILTPFLSLTGLGYFSFAGTIAFMPLMATAVLEFVLGPIYFKRRVDGEAVFHAKVRKLAVVMLAGEFMILAGLILFVREAVHAVGGARYAPAAASCALLTSATFLRSTTPFFSRQILYARKTWIMPAVTVPCAGLAVFVAILGARSMGFLAASWAIVISEIALFVGFFFSVRCIEKVQLPLGMVFCLFAVLLGLSSLMNTPLFLSGIASSVAARLVVFVIIAGISYRVWLHPNLGFVVKLLNR